MSSREARQPQVHSSAVRAAGELQRCRALDISTLTLSILFFIFKPSLILNITQLLSLSLFYT